MSPLIRFAQLVTLGSVVEFGGLATAWIHMDSGRPDQNLGHSQKVDWIGIIGTGQSLSVGARAPTILSSTQPFGNLKLYTAKLPYPIDPNDPQLALVPLVEPIGRLAPNYPSSWPENIDGETLHSAAGNQITALSLSHKMHPIVTVHSAVGEDGQGIVFLKKGAPHKGLNGRSYEGAMTETTAIARLAKAAGKAYAVGAILVTHGESDAGNRNYGQELLQLAADYNQDIKAITGQQRDLLMIGSQQNSVMDDAPSTMAEWQLGVEHPEQYVCSGPKYQYPYFDDAVHLVSLGYDQLGEKVAEVFFERFVLGKKWRPLEPTDANRKGKTISIDFHIPVGKLQWDSTLGTPHSGTSEWTAGKGFELRDVAGKKLPIADVELTRDSRQVLITCPDEIPAGAILSYAMVANPTKRQTPSGGTVRWGLLRDSDPFVGYSTKLPQPNYCVAFRLELQ
jgi:hypothetical protein